MAPEQIVGNLWKLTEGETLTCPDGTKITRPGTVFRVQAFDDKTHGVIFDIQVSDYHLGVTPDEQDPNSGFYQPLKEVHG